MATAVNIGPLDNRVIVTRARPHPPPPSLPRRRGSVLSFSPKLLPFRERTATAPAGLLNVSVKKIAPTPPIGGVAKGTRIRARRFSEAQSTQPQQELTPHTIPLIATPSSNDPTQQPPYPSLRAPPSLQSYSDVTSPTSRLPSQTSLLDPSSVASSSSVPSMILPQDVVHHERQRERDGDWEPCLPGEMKTPKLKQVQSEPTQPVNVVVSVVKANGFKRVETARQNSLPKAKVIECQYLGKVPVPVEQFSTHLSSYQLETQLLPAMLRQFKSQAVPSLAAGVDVVEMGSKGVLIRDNHTNLAIDDFGIGCEFYYSTKKNLSRLLVVKTTTKEYALLQFPRSKQLKRVVSSFAGSMANPSSSPLSSPSSSPSLSPSSSSSSSLRVTSFAGSTATPLASPSPSPSPSPSSSPSPSPSPSSSSSSSSLPRAISMEHQTPSPTPQQIAMPPSQTHSDSTTTESNDTCTLTMTSPTAFPLPHKLLRTRVQTATQKYNAALNESAQYTEAMDAPQHLDELVESTHAIDSTSTQSSGDNVNLEPTHLSLKLQLLLEDIATLTAYQPSSNLVPRFCSTLSGMRTLVFDKAPTWLSSE